MVWATGSASGASRPCSTATPRAIVVANRSRNERNAARPAALRVELLQRQTSRAHAAEHPAQGALVVAASPLRPRARWGRAAKRARTVGVTLRHRAAVGVREPIRTADVVDALAGDLGQRPIGLEAATERARVTLPVEDGAEAMEGAPALADHVACRRGGLEGPPSHPRPHGSSLRAQRG